MTPPKKCNIEPWEDNKFLIGFNCIYDVIWLHQVSGSSNYDDVMTKQVPGVQGANFVGQHLPSVPLSNQHNETLWKERNYLS